MGRIETLTKLLDTGAIAVIRMSDSEKLLKVTDAIYKGGVSAIEITMTTPNALKIIEEMATKAGDYMQIGVGSVLDAETAKSAIAAGATYVVSPVMKKEIIETAHRYDVAAMPGGMTPTEILTAFELGADVVKVYPADVVGMPFIKALLGPMPHLRVMPTGGVTMENAGDWIKAGACAVGIGGALLDKKAIAEENYEALTENAKKFVASVQAARA